MHSALTAVVILFGAALLVAWLMRVIRAPAILGFLLAGILIGPSGLNLIQGHAEPAAPDPAQHVEAADHDAPHADDAHAAATAADDIHFFAELGLVLLLFSIGLELSPTPLLRMGRQLLIATGLQIGSITLLIALMLIATLGLSIAAAIIAGIGVALSSTAIVLKHLSERGEITTPAGTATTGILLIQDIVVILVLILLPLFAAAKGAHWTVFVFKTVAALGGLVAVTLLARLVMPWIVNAVFRFGGTELMTLFAVVMAVTGAWLASLADWSWPLGAFIAGLLLAQCDLRHQLHAEITPFREVFNALFFISIGMLVDLRIFAEHGLVLVAAIIGTLLLKALLTSGAVLVAGWPRRLALTVGIGLCTISEFGYVLVNEAQKLDMVPPGFLALFVAWAVGTMLLGALLIPVAAPIAEWATRQRAELPAMPDKAEDEQPRRSHVVIVGYGINGRNLATVLRATRIPHVVVEMNRMLAQEARDDKAEVLVGDATRQSILYDAGIAEARALVVAISDPRAVRSIVAQAHHACPDLYILARTRHINELDRLMAAGASRVIPEEFETSIEIFAHVLREFAVPDNVIQQQVNLTRAGRYGMLRGRTTADRTIRKEWLQLLEATVTQTYLVMEGSPVCGVSIRDTHLRGQTGVTIVAITRAGHATPSPPPDYVIEAGDVLVLVGTHHQLDRARTALDPPAEEPAAQDLR